MLSRREVAQLFEEKLIQYQAVQVNDKVVVKKGTRQGIVITTEKVKGAKSPQTLVYHASDFSIDVKELLKTHTQGLCFQVGIRESHDL